jgi:uncharacterized protein (TIGR02145 family)
MKKIIYILLTLVVTAGLIQHAAAQVTDLCGNDTIVLSVTNYQYGTIEWEKSTDMEQWTTVPNAHNIVYKFFPEESLYYRAVVKFADCPPEFSAISFVQMPPVANAGFDRVVPGNQAALFANQVAGADGQWTIVSGTNGSLSNASAPNAILTGNDGQYTLVWTLSNTCGTSRDTVQVRFRQNVYTGNRVVVDATDTILSNHQQLGAGLYVIKFSDPVPTITNGTFLIGMTGYGFLRKVESFTAENNVFTMQTSQAGLEDITEQGAFELAPDLNFGNLQGSGSKRAGNYERLDRLPTRHELNTDPKFKTGIYYYETQKQPLYLYPGVTLSTLSEKDDEPVPLINLEFNSTLYNAGPFQMNLSGHYQFFPNLVVDLEYYLGKVYYFKMGMSNATVEKNIALDLQASSEFTLAETEYTLLSASRYIVFIVGALPLVVELNFTLAGAFNASFEAEFNAGVAITETDTYLSYIQYAESQGWQQWHRPGSSVAVKPTLAVSGALAQDFSIGPRVSFSLYGQLGPYIDLKLKEELEACFNNDNWVGSVGLNAELSLGVLGKMLSKELFDYNKMWPANLYKYTYPDHISYWSGNNQTYVLGEELKNSIKVRVKGTKGLSLPFARVRFSPLCGGSVRDEVVSTDILGLAETYWTPADSVESKLEAYVLNCDEENIDKAPLVFVAYADTTNPCALTGLSVSVHEADSTISPLAEMGVAPYQYSTNDGPFSSLVPIITPAPGDEYTFTVKDSEECLASVSYTAPDPCYGSTLALAAVATGDTLTVETSGGAPPFLYSTNESPFSETIPFIITTPGESYTITVKDDVPCQATVNYTAPGNCGYLMLALNVDNDNSTITAFGAGGTPPYLYSMGDTTNFSARNEFVNLSGGTYKVYVKDSDGCISHQFADVPIAEVVIGDQVWMQYNLSMYVGNSKWPSSSYCAEFYPPGHQAYGECIFSSWYTIEHTEYGRLYDWESAMSACPPGWRLPSTSDWYKMTIGWGGGGKLKSTRTSDKIQIGDQTYNNPDGHPFWYAPNTGATNEKGFNALPADWLGHTGTWWTTDMNPDGTVQVMGMSETHDDLYETDTWIGNMYSVRCLKDVE